MKLHLISESRARIIEIRYTDLDPFKDWPPKKTQPLELHDEDEFGEEGEGWDKAVIRKLSNNILIYEYQPGEYDQPKRIVVYPTGVIKYFKDWTEFEKSFEYYEAFLGDVTDNVKQFEEQDYVEFNNIFNGLKNKI